jgi:OOP family OmpA-OmpF porin
MLICLAAAGCGGVTQFQDETAIAVMGKPPPPPPPPPEPEPERRVELAGDRINIKEKIQFGYNSDKILQESFSLMDEIAQVMKENPQIKKVEIGGHASSEGSDAYNRELSDKRAKAVMAYLVGKGGIDASRLTAKGYGESKPLVTPDDTEAKKEKNRRVEFLILEQEVTKKRVEVDPKTGEEKVIETFTEVE